MLSSSTVKFGFRGQMHQTNEKEELKKCTATGLLATKMPS